MPHKTILDNISIVLVDTKTPGNIGAVARCMMNMDLSRLVLVRPFKYLKNEAVKFAAGAGQILDQAITFGSLAEAIADHGLVVGTSRQMGKRRKNILAPREAMEEIIALLPQNRVAIVFGGEVNGLNNEDISLCRELVSIPSSDEFPSLNLSHAVMIVAYELYLAAGARIPAAKRALARSSELEGFYAHLQDTLNAVQFLDKGNTERMMFSLRQLFGRARPDERDVSILRGILSRVSKFVKSKPA